MNLANHKNIDDRMTEEELALVMAEGRQIVRAPDVVRARLLARAREAVAASRTAAPLVMPASAPAWRGWRIATAAGAVLVLSGAGAGAALYTRVPRLRDAAPAAIGREPARTRITKRPAVQAPAPDLGASEPAAQLPVSRPKMQRARQLLTPQESYAAELRLLQGAQSDYTSQDFPDALVLLAEHARRFPDGRLAEEREALRIRSLDGAGRADEARHALAAFGRRFPRSALLPRLQQQLRGATD